MKDSIRVAVVVVGLALLCGRCSARIGYFWHLSDNHMQSDYKEGTDPNWHCTKGQGRAGKFGDYDCRAPYPVEYTAISLIPSLAPDECKNNKPEFILWTGDCVASRNGQYGHDEITWDLVNVTDLFDKLQRMFGWRIPVYPVIGNHDSSPQHQLKAENDWVYPVVAKQWSNFLPDECLLTLKKSGYYSLKVNARLRLIVLNTPLYYELNNETLGITDPGGQIKWFKEQLADAKKKNELVYIAGHVPPRGSGGCFRPEYAKPFLQAMEGYHSMIKASFWGHCHQDTFQLIGNITSGDFHVGHYAPTLGTNYHTNPAFRRYIIDTDTYEVKNWRTFFMDLPTANNKKKIEWNILYDAQHAYGIPDATPKSMYSLMNKIANDKTLFNTTYYRMNCGGPMNPCNDQCHKKIVCQMMYPHMYGYEECLNH